MFYGFFAKPFGLLITDSFQLFLCSCQWLKVFQDDRLGQFFQSRCKILASPKISALVFFWSEMRVSFKALARFLLFQSQRRCRRRRRRLQRLRRPRRRRLRRRRRWRLGRFNQSVLFQSMTGSARSQKASAWPVESVQGILWKWGFVVNFWPFNSNLHFLCGK